MNHTNGLSATSQPNGSSDGTGERATKRPVGYLDTWKPYGSTQVLLARVQDVLAEYADYLPLTVRQIYYRMIGAWGYPKGKSFEAQLSDALVNARRARIIPFEHIRDDGIMGGGFWYSGIEQFRYGQYLKAKNYRRDLQHEQEVRVQVWCEAAGMIPQLQRIAFPYSIPVYSCSGFNSLTSIRQVVDSCVEDTSGPTVLLHLGDYDPSGESIFDRVSRDVAAFLEEDALYSDQTFTAERVVLTREQIDQHELPMDLIKTKDSRSLKWIAEGRTHKAELEALAPDLIARFLQEAIHRHVNDYEHEEAKRLQVRERAVVWTPEPKSGPSGVSFETLLRNVAHSNNGRTA